MNEARLCPRCGILLEERELLEENPVRVDMCPACHGIWFDNGELSAILEAVKEPDAEISRQVLTALAESNAIPEEVRYIKCPVCEQIMNRQCYGHRSGVVTDRCKNHGIWLDGGELERLFGWVAAGGHILDRKVAAEREKTARRREEERRQRLAQLGPLEEDVPVVTRLGGRPRRSILGEALGDLLAGLFMR